MDHAIQPALTEGVIKYNDEHGRFECLLCEINLTGEDNIKEHLTSKQHRETGARYAIEKWRTSPESIKALLPKAVHKAVEAREISVLASKEILCHICNMPSTGVVPLNDHLISKNHRKKKESKLTTDGSAAVASSCQSPTLSSSVVQEAIDDGVAECRSLNDFYCKICYMSSNGEVSFEQHLDSKKHSEAGARKVFKNFAGSPRSLMNKLPDVVKEAARHGLVTVTDSNALLCNTCKVPSSGVASLKEHLLGDEHRKTQAANRAFDTLAPVQPVPSRATIPSPFENDKTFDSSEIEKEKREGIIDELDDKINKFCCNVCTKKFGNAGPLIEHLKSKKHIQKKLLQKQHRELVPREHAEVNVTPAQNTPSSRRSYSVIAGGHVYIFNNTFKGTQKARKGAEHDSRNLKAAFEVMGYKVFLLEDLTKRDMDKHLERIQKDSVLNEIDAFVLFFLSHGKDNYTFYANDEEEMDLHKIRRMFTDRKCPYLKGKPKIFFANYCRGNQMEKKKIEFDDIEAPCDMATIHAATEGIMAKRDKDKGTIFVSSLCKVLDDHSDWDLYDIFLELEKEMRANQGTIPVWENNVFKHFCFHEGSS